MYKTNNTGDFIMKNTVKLEQFKKLTEKELQEIQGGERRIPDVIRSLLFQKRK